MNRKRLNELRRIARKALLEITDAELKAGPAEMEPMPTPYKTRGTAKGNPSDLGGFTQNEILEKLKKLFEEVVATQPDLAKVHTYLNDDALKTGYAKACLAAGNDNDKVPATEGDFTIKDGIPTQREIFFPKSVAYPMGDPGSAIEQLDNTAKSNSNLFVNFMLGKDGTYILDGHHRWSGAWAFGDKEKLQLHGQQFNFSVGIEQALASLQLGVAAQMPVGADIPSAGGGSQPVNVFDTDEKGLFKYLIDALAAGATMKQLDPKAHIDNVILGPEWMDALLPNALFQAWLKAALAAHKGKLTAPAKDVSDLVSQRNDAQPDQCPVRIIICAQVAKNYKGLPLPKTAIARPDMPQLDGKTGNTVTDSKGKQKSEKLKPADMVALMNQGVVNVANKFHYPDSSTGSEVPESSDGEEVGDSSDVNESIDLRRWGKLAGLLKD